MSEQRSRPSLAFRVALIAAAGILLFASTRPDTTTWHRLIVPATNGFLAAYFLRYAVKTRDPIYLVLCVFNAFTAAGVLMRHEFDAPRWALIVATVGMVASLLVFCGLLVRDRMREKELDRLIFSEASSLAFFAVMGLGITYGFAEGWLELNRPSPFLFVAAGAVAYSAAKIAQRRKYF